MVYTNNRANGSRKGRPNYPREFKQRLVAAANQPGVSVSKLAQEHGVNANLLFKWRRDASSKPPALYPIELVLPPSSTRLGEKRASKLQDLVGLAQFLDLALQFLDALLVCGGWPFTLAAISFVLTHPSQ